MLKEYFKKNEGICKSGFISLDFAANEYWNSMCGINPDTVIPGECLYVNVGSDHCFDVFAKFNRIANEIEEMGLELYQDPEAHYTVGSKLPKDEG